MTFRAPMPTATRRRVNEPFPAKPWSRWLLRAGLAAPFVVIAVLLIQDSGLLSRSVNGTVEARVDTIDWGRADLNWVADLYPPFGTLLVKLIPGGAAGLSIVGALAAGWFLQYLIQTLRERHWQRRNIVLTVLAVGGNPVFAYLVVGDLLGFLGLAAFSYGTIEMYRFIMRRNTDAGFRAGVWFLICSLVDPSGLLLIVVAMLTAPALTVARANERGARLANIAVIFYPTIAAAVTIMLMQAIYLNDPFALYSRAIIYSPENWSVFATLFTTPGGWTTLLAALFGAAVAALGRRYVLAFIAPLVLVAILLGRVLGLVPLQGVGYVLLTTTMIIVTLLPSLSGRLRRTGVSIVLCAFIVLGWVTGLVRAPIVEWFVSFTGGIA
ncbi:hypothetical protein GCM10010922_13190 [Microbacterium sorbitolivorans]|uniref:hypothetical protein n=1 Tax=Microbacterium sorbitolivorans TaxID=1867410 RepID=UPI0019C8A2D4|nr:hypothetical protein [Microbacterium sorbitolivorans]GGF39219.1 hypothetical protein GCM10010922_13190 [Microbacterium sorbitolivorans]